MFPGFTESIAGPRQAQLEHAGKQQVTLCKIRGFLICVYRKPIGNVMRNVVGNLSKPKDTACFHVFCEKLRKNLVILPCPGVSLPKKHHVSLHFPLRKPHILRSVIVVRSDS